MKTCMREYKEKLEKQIGELMKLPISERNVTLVDNLVEKWNHIKEIEKECDASVQYLTNDDIEQWNSKMKNSDGTTYGHWTIDQTTPLQEQVGANDVSNKLWNVTMNMIYSDYGEVAKKFNVNTPQFYAHLANAFLHDMDAPKPEEKMAAYYHSIVH